jgi:hypothetical protein
MKFNDDVLRQPPKPAEGATTVATIERPDPASINSPSPASPSAGLLDQEPE